MNIFGPPFDWAATGSMLQGAATLIGSVAVLVAAKLGANTFGAWRNQKVAERHIEQAERILTATYKARRALGSGLIDQSQKMTVAARAMAEKKALGHLS